VGNRYYANCYGANATMQGQARDRRQVLVRPKVKILQFREISTGKKGHAVSEVGYGLAVCPCPELVLCAHLPIFVDIPVMIHRPGIETELMLV